MGNTLKEENKNKNKKQGKNGRIRRAFMPVVASDTSKKG